MTGDEVKGTDERTTLADYLDLHRATLVRKVAGLTEEQTRQAPVPSGTSLRGLLSHLTCTERWWFAHVVGRLEVEFPWSDADPDADWHPPEDVTLADLVAAYEAECARSRAVLAAADLDAVVVEEGWGPRTVRWVLAHMVEETARHNGHADILRELADGATGV